MRYIGNKTRLLGFIREVLRRRGIAAGTAVDPFTGTASVARALKRWGFHVVAADLMEYAYVFGRAYVEIQQVPDLSRVPMPQGIVRPGVMAPDLHPGTVHAREFPGVPDGLPDGVPRDGPVRRRARRSEPAATLDVISAENTQALGAVIAHLNAVEIRPGFLHEHFSPGGQEGRAHDRMYFTPENAAHIDTVRELLEEWRGNGSIDDDGFHLLLAALIEAADAVANTAGVYAACIKQWQPNALRRLRLKLPSLVPGNGCRAARTDALSLVRDMEPFELLYLDPPYNNRQYPGYYHIPELLAGGWFDGDVTLRGKTGLLPDADKRSDWCRQRRCEGVFEELVASAPWRRLVMSYNTEGIIPERTIERVLKQYGRAATYRRYRRQYRRYRSDSDSAQRRYRGDVVSEYLYCVDR